jgi:hypothetical protein
MSRFILQPCTALHREQKRFERAESVIWALTFSPFNQSMLGTCNSETRTTSKLFFSTTLGTGISATTRLALLQPIALGRLS